MRLLLAEDEKEMSAALSAILTHSGYDVDAVYDGQAAVEKALSQSYDCMIFDIMMPKKDGVQALKEIRDKGNMTPVIMLTAKAEIDDRITGLDAGADDFNAEDNVFEITTDPDAFNDVVKALEEKIAYARQFYNDVVQKYNTKIEVVPTNIIAGLFHFEQAAYFQVDEADRQAPQVKF